MSKSKKSLTEAERINILEYEMEKVKLGINKAEKEQQELYELQHKLTELKKKRDVLKSKWRIL